MTVLPATERLVTSLHPDDSHLAPTHIQKAADAGHPFQEAPLVPDDVAEVIFLTLTMGPTAVKAFRLQQLQHFEDMAESLENQEKNLHDLN